MISAVRQTVIPERLKNRFPSANATLPLRTALRSRHHGYRSNTFCSSRLRFKLNPQGATIRYSGSASCSCSEGIAAEYSPFFPSRSSPFAISTSSGPQFPIANIGSAHSSMTTVGREKRATFSLTMSNR